VAVVVEKGEIRSLPVAGLGPLGAGDCPHERIVVFRGEDQTGVVVQRHLVRRQVVLLPVSFAVVKVDDLAAEPAFRT